MKQFKQTSLALGVISLISIVSFAQAEKNDLILNLGYFNNNNQIQYLQAETKSKIDGKFQMVPGISITFYLGTEDPAHLLGKSVTDDNGDAVLFIPATAQKEWGTDSKHSFIAVSTPTKLYDETRGTFDLTKAKLVIDTTTDKNIVVTISAFNDSVWTPVKGVDIKVAVKRMGGDLGVNETATFTSDSTGTITAEYKRDSLPGDAKGNIVLVAKVEDNDLYGNLSMEKTVPWGVPVQYVSEYDKRTLFARRGRAPVWLELMAYSTILVVWGVLLYLLTRISKLKKLGAETTA
jgi:hypothetical protein